MGRQLGRSGGQAREPRGRDVRVSRHAFEREEGLVAPRVEVSLA
jgi:hypothetical protein